MDSNGILPELVEVNIEVPDQESVLIKLSRLLYENGFVKESYSRAVIDREKGFPTGLIAKPANVAIPHTDVDHVIKPGIAIGILKTPVKFGLMGSPGETVDVKIVFMLAITDPKMQVHLLSDLTRLFHDQERMTRLTLMKEKEDTVSLIRSIFE